MGTLRIVARSGLIKTLGKSRKSRFEHPRALAEGRRVRQFLGFERTAQNPVPHERAVH